MHTIAVPQWVSTDSREHQLVAAPAFTLDISGEVRDGYEKLPERERLLQLWSRDADFARQDGVQVSSAAGFGATVSLATVASWLATVVPFRTGSYKFDDAVFEDAYREIESDVRSPTMRETATAVLVGVDPASVPFTFSDEVTISTLSRRELAMALEAGFLPIHAGRAYSYGMLALRVSRDWPKVFGDANPPPRPASTPPPSELIADAITALRLHVPGRISHSGIVAFAHYLSSSGSSYAPGEPQREWGINYRIQGSDAHAIRTIWDALRSDSLRSDRALQTALRRFNLSAERRLAEDKILDLLIATEAALLADQSDPFTQGELTYRLSIRAARLLRSDRESRRALQREWSRSYGARSAIAHGGSLDDFQKKLKATPDQIAATTEANVREVLRELVLRRARGDVVDWEDVVLS